MKRDAPHPRLIVAIGLPASGKSAGLAAILDGSGIAILSSDSIRAEVCGSESDMSQDPKVWTILRSRIAKQIGSGQDVAVDATNVKRRDRMSLITLGRRYGARYVQGIWFDTPIEVCRARNLQRPRQVPDLAIAQMAATLLFEPPTTADGFDDLVTIA